MRRPQSNQRGIETWTAQHIHAPRRGCLNRTSVGLKHGCRYRDVVAMLCLNRTSVGLKLKEALSRVPPDKGLNRTSVGLKRRCQYWQLGSWAGLASIEPAWD